jgi:signal transduction histidine kinase
MGVATARRLDFVTVVAHDLRQPMSAALMAAELVEGYLDDASAIDLARKHLAMAKRCLRETLQLASDLLAMEQAETGVLRLRRAPVDVAALLRDAAALVAQEARAKRIDVRVRVPRVPRALPCPRADRGRLLQVLTNLSANAVKFTQRGGRVTLAATCDGCDVHVSVSDSGPGLSDDELPRVFDSHWQGPSDAAAEGVGLGLTIARSLVEAHGGRITARRSPGGGLAIVFTIPLAER